LYEKSISGGMEGGKQEGTLLPSLPPANWAVSHLRATMATAAQNGAAGVLRYRQRLRQRHIALPLRLRHLLLPAISPWICSPVRLHAFRRYVSAVI